MKKRINENSSQQPATYIHRDDK